MKKLFSGCALALFAGIGSLNIHAQGTKQQTTFCNPLNLNYRFMPVLPSRREAADPVLISFKGAYFLFASKSGGYWSSTDLINWNFITSPDLPWEDYAPTAVVMRDSVYFMALDRKIYKTADPLSGRWQVARDSFPIYAGDPALFLDDDGRLYLYHGLSNTRPIYGMELDPKTFEPLGKEVECLNTNSRDHGWERRGDYNTDKGKPFLEGAWMTKYRGKYYLQYSAPGTQFKSYSDGLYIGNAPLGPFRLADHNPFSYKPEGFIASAGHSSTFQDRWGNYWHAATMTVSVKERFERRLGLFPAFFDQDGTFYTYTGFGDFPHKMPQKRMKGPEDYQPSGMLLSYNKPVSVSSESADHPKNAAADENIRTWWSAATGNKGEWILLDLQSPCSVNAVQINFADEATTLLGRSNSVYYQYLLEYSTDGKTWNKLADKTTSKTDVPHDYVELSAPVTARYIRLTNHHVPDGKFALSGLRIFGKGTGKPPAAVSSFKVVRDTADGRNVTLKWQKSPAATGYNIRYGTSPDKLYQNYLVFDTDTLTIHSLNRLHPYYFTIDAFNENGITNGTVMKAASKEAVTAK